MPDNLIVADLQEVNDDLPGAAVRFRFFDEDGSLFSTLISTKSSTVPGRFTAAFSGAAGVYFGHVELRRSDSENQGEYLWQQTGQQIDTFAWSGTDFLYPLNTASDIGNITKVNGSTSAAAALQAALVGAGAIRSNVVQVAGQTALAVNPVDFGNLGTIAEGVPRSSSATAQVVTAGTVITGGFATTAADDGSYFSIAPGPTGLNVTLEFTIGSQFPMGVTVNGRYNAIIMNRFCNVFAWNWITSAWEQISDSVTRMNNSNSDANYSYPLLARHREGSGTVGRVRIGFQSADTLNTIRLELDQVLVKSVSAAITTAEIVAAVYDRLVFEAYRRDLGVVIDTVNGVPGSKAGDNGIAQAPVNNLADALLIANAASIKTQQFYIVGGSSLTISQGFTNWGFLGQSKVLWTVALNGQLLTGCGFSDARVSGTGLSTGARIRFENCIIGTVTLGNTAAVDSVLGSSAGVGSIITPVSGADISFRDCSTVAMASLPAINFASPGATTQVRVQGHRGSIRVQNMNANSQFQFGGNGQVTIEASCTAGTVVIESTALVVNLAGPGVTVQRLNVIADLTATLQTPGVFSTAALANAPTGGGSGGGLDAAGVRAAIGLGSANLDTQLSAIDAVVDAILVDTDATLPGLIDNVPTNAEFAARTLPSADYFVVGDYTAPANGDITAIKAKTDNLPTDPADQSAVEAAITAARSVVTTAIAALPDPLDATATQAAAAAAITAANLSTYDGGDTQGTTTLLARLTATRAGHLDTIPTLSTLTSGDIASALAAYPVAKPSDVQVTVNPTPVFFDGGFSPGDRANLTAAKTAAEEATSHTRPMAKQLGLVEGVSATHSDEGIVVSDGDGNTTITPNLDGSYTVEGAP